MFNVGQIIYDPLLSATGTVRDIVGDYARVYYPELGERSRAMSELLPKRVPAQLKRS